MTRAECLQKLEGIFWSDTYKDVQNAGKVLDEYTEQLREALESAEKALNHYATVSYESESMVDEVLQFTAESWLAKYSKKD